MEVDGVGRSGHDDFEVICIGRMDAIVILYSFVFLFVNICFGS